jgi:tryptophanyl-tRNA synthetase
VTEAVNERLRPLRTRRAELAADPDVARELLRRGNERANALADATLERVSAAMGMRC